MSKRRSDEEIEALENRLREAEETLSAIHSGQIDALIVSTPEGEKTFTLSGADQVYRLIMDAMAEGAVVLTPDGAITYCNERFAQLAHRSLSSLTGSSALKLVAPSSLGAFRLLIQQAVFKPCGGEVELIDDEGNLLSVYLSVSTVQTPAGRAACLVVSDLTESKKSALFEALRKSEAQFRLLADSVPQLAWAAGPDGVVDYYNKRWYEAIDRGRKDPGSRSYVHADDLASTNEVWDRSIANGTPFQLEHRLLHQSGEHRWHLSRALPMKDESGKIVRWFGTSTDIHDSKMAQDQLSQANAELRKTQEQLIHSNTELARFAYVASHDLKEPLRVISSYAQLLKLTYANKLDEKANLHIGFIVDGVKRMYSLIEDLLSYSRIGSNPDDLSPTDLNQVLQLAQMNLATSIDEARAEIHCPKPLPTLPAVAGQMLQLFQNLLGNAIKYRHPDRPAKIEVSAVKSDNTWVFSVQDNGIGIEEAYYERVFELFQRLHTKKEYPGTGIGLAVCKRIVERHGGHIWVESAKGIGSTFFFTLLDDVDGKHE